MTATSRSIEEEYVFLAHQVDVLLKEKIHEDTIVVDSYFGPPLPPAWESITDPDQLHGALKSLGGRIRKEIQVEPKRTFLKKQVNALNLLVKYAMEEPVSFEERIQTGLDVEVVTIKSERIEELTEEATRALLKRIRKANLTSMATNWQKRSLVTGTEIIDLAKDATESARRSTQRLLFDLPNTEKVDFRPVSEAPWSAYHYYQGNFQSLIEINIKLPQSKYDLWSWITHETYPGHQTQLVTRELDFRRDEQGLERAITVINTPDSVMAEGLAEAGTTILSQDRPLKAGEMVSQRLQQLRRAIGINALVMLHQMEHSEQEVLEYLKDMGAYEEEYAKARLPFMKDPMWAPYGFAYFVGGWLVKGFFEAAQVANLIDEFITALYHELHTPSSLRLLIRNLGLKLPPLTG